MSQQINLFDASLQKQFDPWTAHNVGSVVAVLLAITVLWGGWTYWHKSTLTQQSNELAPQLETAQNEVKQLGEQLRTLKPDNALLQELDDARARLMARSEVLEILKKGLAPEATSQADWLRGFARQVPNGLWLTAFNINTDTNALDIRGRTIDPALIPEYMRRLSAEKPFKGRTFAALEIAKTAPAANPVGGIALAPEPLPAGTAVPAAKPAPANNFHEFVLISTQSATATPVIGSKP
ncbi:MAG TPA: PilN domain-containing protein [Rhodocyclaceae bacterium]|jgi:hypothetical protein|nr:PilN domain-containing protein [Rhodocyclaceae bacterium]